MRATTPLTPGQRAALAQLAGGDWQTTPVIAAGMGRDGQNANIVLGGLYVRGLVERQMSAQRQEGTRWRRAVSA